MHVRLACLIVATTVLSGFTAPCASAQDQPGRKFALLIGVDKYEENTGLRSLNYSEKDVTDLGDVLGKFGYEVTLLTRAEWKKQDKDFLRPTARNIREHVAVITKNRKPGDTVLVAFSGHGVHLKSTDALYYCPSESDLGDAKSLVAVNDVLAALETLRAGSKALLMDACRNDPADGNTAAAPPNLKSVTRPLIAEPKGGTVALFSCSTGQKAFESATLKRGFMMHYVIDGLVGGAANLDGEITWLRLSAHVAERVPDAVRKEKGPKVEQTPEALGKTRGIVLARTGRKAGTEVKFTISPDGTEMTFCWIPAGIATLGSPKDEKWRDQYEPERKFVTGGFWLGKFEVTQSEWVAVMGKAENRAYYRPGSEGAIAVGDLTALQIMRLPIEMVSWDDCQRFLKRVNLRMGAEKAFGQPGTFALPDEDSWEYACRGGTGNAQPFYWGKRYDGTQANCGSTAFPDTDTVLKVISRPAPVGSYATIAPHPWGLCDMHGNLLEWCSDQYRVKGYDHCRVRRGGSHASGGSGSRAAAYNGADAQKGDQVTGFRVAFIPK